MRFALSALLLIGLAACSSSEPFPVKEPPRESPLAGFPSSSILVVASEATAQSLAVLSLDTASGEVGLLPGSPAETGVVIGDVETLAADPARRRVFFGSNRDGAIAVLTLDAGGAPLPAAGSPFTAEHPGVSVIKSAPSGDVLYVGYHAQSTLSRYAVDAAGSLTLVQSVSAAPARHVETMLQVGDVLYVGFADSSNIVGFRLDAQEAFATDGSGNPVIVADVATNVRPDYLVAIGDKLYCSLAVDGSVDAFQIEADGSLTRLGGAPYAFPGIGTFELIAVEPGGARIAVGAEAPSAAVGVYTVNPDGSLTPSGSPLFLHERKGGPEGLTYSADGRFLYVCDHVGWGLYVLDMTGASPALATVPRYKLPGRQVDVLRLELSVN